MEKKQSAKLPWTIVLLILAFSCALAYGIATLATRVFADDSFGKVKNLGITNVQGIQVTQSGFVYYDGSTVTNIGSTGVVNWSYLVGVDAGFDATDYGVATWVGPTITLIDGATGTTTYNGTMDSDVLSARIGEKYTAILVGPEDDSTIVLMENGGKQVNRIAMDHVTAVDYGFFSNGSLLWVMACNTNGTVPTTDIQTYKPGKEIVGSISDTEQMMYAVMFQSSQVCVAGDTYFKRYDYTGMEDTDQRKLIYGWVLAGSDEHSTDPLMAFVTDAQYGATQNIRDLRLMRSNLDQVMRLPFGCIDLVVANDTVYGFSGDGHVLIARPGVQKADAYQLDLLIDEVYGVTLDGVAVVGYGGNIYLVNLE